MTCGQMQAHAARRSSRPKQYARRQGSHPFRGRLSCTAGQPADRFIYIEDGEIEVVNPYTNERHLPFTLGPTQFMGEISFLSGASGRCLCAPFAIPGSSTCRAMRC